MYSLTHIRMRLTSIYLEYTRSSAMPHCYKDTLFLCITYSDKDRTPGNNGGKQTNTRPWTYWSNYKYGNSKFYMSMVIRGPRDIVVHIPWYMVTVFKDMVTFFIVMVIYFLEIQCINFDYARQDAHTIWLFIPIQTYLDKSWTRLNITSHTFFPFQGGFYNVHRVRYYVHGHIYHVQREFALPWLPLTMARDTYNKSSEICIMTQLLSSSLL
jgi:hypothetical protein